MGASVERQAVAAAVAGRLTIARPSSALARAALLQQLADRPQLTRMTCPAPGQRRRSRVRAGCLAVAVTLLAACRAPEGAQATRRGNEVAIGVALNPVRPGMQTIL